MGKLNAFGRIAQDLGKYMRLSGQDEYQDYTNQAPYIIGKMLALVWWGQEPQGKRWLRLFLMTLDILSIPDMSDEVFQGHVVRSHGRGHKWSLQLLIW